MLMEGVPPAMIENTAKMAGMPVGPLSLNDEVAIDLALKIVKATEAELGERPSIQQQKKLIDRDGREAGPPRPQERQGLLRLSREGQGQKTLWPRLAALQPKHLDPDTIDVEELKQRFLVVQAVEAARTVEDTSSSIRARPMSARSSASASRPSPAARCPTSTAWAPRTSWRCATSWKPNTAPASPRRSCWRHGQDRRDLLPAFRAEEAGRGVKHRVVLTSPRLRGEVRRIDSVRAWGIPESGIRVICIATLRPWRGCRMLDGN